MVCVDTLQPLYTSAEGIDIKDIFNNDGQNTSFIGIGSRGAPGAGAPPVFTVTP